MFIESWETWNGGVSLKYVEEYRLEQVAVESYLLTAFNEDDHLIIGNGTWDFVDGDVIIHRPWTVGESLDKDPLPLVPQQVFIHNLPWIMWSEDVIARICSALGLQSQQGSYANTRGVRRHRPLLRLSCIIHRRGGRK